MKKSGKPKSTAKTTKNQNNKKHKKKTFEKEKKNKKSQKKSEYKNKVKNTFSDKKSRFARQKSESEQNNIGSSFEEQLPVSGINLHRRRKPKKVKILVKDNTTDNAIRLNKFIANAGICSRREADKLIESGVISVNGKIVTQLGTKVLPTDIVKFHDKVLSGEPLRYLLLNKPKGYITTTDDPNERKTVMELIKGACKERIYPVGRLDRNTTGLLLFTNDGELAKRLTHPKHKVEKVYKVVLNKNLSKPDMEKIIGGIELEDGFIKADAIAYGESKREIGIELHSGKNRIVRRIFEHLGYEVVKLDRVVFAGLTKKNLPRGKYRFLTEEEVNILRRIK